jgi:hypothetical protein
MRKKKNTSTIISEYRIKDLTGDGHSSGQWWAEDCRKALSCQIMALKNRKTEDAQIISVECLDRFSKKWIDHTPDLLEAMQKFNNNK